MNFVGHLINAFNVASVACMTAILISCQQSPPRAETVKIGLLAYTEDEHKKSIGVPTVNAARMAVEEINRAGGVKLDGGRADVELVVNGVVASSPQNAVAAFRKMTNRDKVSAVVGLQYSVDAIPAGAFAEKARIPFISPMSTNNRTTRGREFVFRMSFVDEQQGGVMARFAYHDLGSRRAAVLFDRTDPYSSGIAEVFSSTYLDLGGAVVSWQPYVQHQVDYDMVVDQIKKAGPDILYLPGFGVEVARQVEIIKNKQVDAVLLGGDGWDMQAFAGNVLFDNSYATAHWFSNAHIEGSEQFVENYTANFGDPPDAVAALTYDAMHILFAALEHSGSKDGVLLRNALIDMESFKGVSGAVDFVASGNPDKGVTVLRLNDGKTHLERIVKRGER